MKRAFALALILGAVPGCGGEPVADFSGRWLFGETDPDCRHESPECWVEIEQRGDRVTLRAWGKADDWTCDGRGTVEGNRLKFRWAGTRKNWSGWAEFVLDGDRIMATHQRDTVSAALQTCEGRRQAVPVSSNSR